MKVLKTLLSLVVLMVSNKLLAQSWMPANAPAANWFSIASSADGAKLAAVSMDGQICTSTDSGFTWTSNAAPYETWTSIASSADGTKLVAGTFDGKIYTSTNSGGDWTFSAAPTQNRYSLASSADGSRLAAAPVGGPIYLSTDSGISWMPGNAPDTYWTSVTSSADGTKLAATWTLDSNGGIYTSTNAGMTWEAKNPPLLPWYSVASSADGKKLVMAAYDPAQIYTSTDSGNTWVSNSIAIGYLEYLNKVASSADGCRLAAGTSGNDAFVSTDSGETWSPSDSPLGLWNSITSSADGTKLAAVVVNWVHSSSIYTWQSTPSPSLAIAPGITNLTLSWIIPSMNFTLQQSSDLAKWVDVTNPPILNLTNLQNEVTIPKSSGNLFYRLKIP